MADRPTHRLQLLATPTFAASVVLLLLNDHVLKAEWPGVVTGKLSDVAGVAMVAIALTAVSGSRGFGFGVTVVAFTALKTAPAVAAGAAPLLGGITRTDPTDLVAFVALVPLWRHLCPQRARTDGVAASLALRVVCASAAVLATTATSCASGGVWDLHVVDGLAYARVENDVWVSADGGAGWRRTDIHTDDPRFDDPIDGSCAGGRCFEIRQFDDPPRIVDVTAGGADELIVWDTEQREALSRAVNWSCEDGSLSELVAVDHDGAISVIVSMTEAGTLRWSSATEAWTWVAVGGWGLEGSEVASVPVATQAVGPGWIDTGWPTRVVSLVTTVGAVASMWWVAGLAESRRRRATGYVWAVAAVAAASTVPLAFFWLWPVDWRLGLGGERLVGALVIAVGSSVAIGVVAALANRPPRPLEPPPETSRVG